MNFWRSFGFYTPSPIDNILERDAFELEELLAEDDINQELNSHNKNLIAYLSKPNVLETIVRYATEPDFRADELDEARRKKYGGLCADILALESWAIADGITQSGLVERLCAFLYTDAPFDRTVAAQGSRILGSLLQQKPGDVLEYIQSREDSVSRFLSHLQCAPVMDLLLRFIKCDDIVTRAGSPKGTVQWLREEKLISRLVALLGPDQPSSVHENAAHALCEIASAAHESSPLLAELLSEDVCREVFTHAFHKVDLDSSALKHSLPLLSTLIAHVPVPVSDDPPLPPVLSIFQQHVPRVKELLESHSGNPQLYTFGELSPPFGFVRMKVMEICCAVMKSKYESLLYKVFVDDGLFATCMNLFFRYEFNNMLHRLVADMVKTVLTGSDLALKTALFEECELHNMIAEHGVTTNAKGHRRGYMGYLTDISLAIEQEAQELHSIKERLESSPQWKKYCETEFHATRQLLYPQFAQADENRSRFSTDEEAGDNPEWEDFSKQALTATEDEDNATPMAEETPSPVEEETPSPMVEEEEAAVVAAAAGAGEEGGDGEVTPMEEEVATEEPAAAEEPASEEASVEAEEEKGSGEEATDA